MVPLAKSRSLSVTHPTSSSSLTSCPWSPLSLWPIPNPKAAATDLGERAGGRSGGGARGCLGAARWRGLPRRGAALWRGLPRRGAARAGCLDAARRARGQGWRVRGVGVRGRAGLAREQRRRLWLAEQRSGFFDREMATNSSYADKIGSIRREISVVVRMSAYFSIPDGLPKTYCRRTILSPIVVNANSYGLMQLVNHIADHFLWGSKQFFFFCGVNLNMMTIDEQLLQWIEMNLDKGVVHIIAEINDFEGPLQCSPTKRSLHPKVRERLLKTPSTPSLNLDPRVDPTQLTQYTPTKERTTSTKKKVTSSKGSKKSMSDGSVGVDEEGMYSDTDSLVAMSDSSYDTDLAASSDSNIDPSDVEYDTDFQNIASWISKTKDRHVVQMIDQIRLMIITKFQERRKVGHKMVGRIIPDIINTLNAQSKKINDHEVLICGNGTAEVTVSIVRHAVNLEEKTCSYRAWQVCGQPCSHALATIGKRYIWKTLSMNTSLWTGSRRLMRVISNQ
ncbi:hypothetical protein EJB05_24282, partial [Eragrostis curvula]